MDETMLFIISIVIFFKPSC